MQQRIDARKDFDLGLRMVPQTILHGGQQSADLCLSVLERIGSRGDPDRIHPSRSLESTADHRRISLKMAAGLNDRLTEIEPFLLGRGHRASGRPREPKLRVPTRRV
ncbi:MAG: hypothetical protein GY895_01935 [Phycisphaera sp.]|nr:hypothetical protein [Phycisphaera sp.]